MRLGLTAGVRRLLSVALIVLMSAAPAVASGFAHLKSDAAGAAHCHDDATNAVSKDTSGEAVGQHEHPSAATNSGTSQPDECFTACCGLACHASMAMLTGTFLPPPSNGTRVAPAVFTGLAERDTDRIDRPPISRL